MLSTTAKTNICKVLEALVNAGGVRPEDDSVVTTALADLKAELATDESTLADHEKRISALEDLDNGVETTLDPPAPAPAGTASQAPAPLT